MYLSHARKRICTKTARGFAWNRYRHREMENTKRPVVRVENIPRLPEVTLSVTLTNIEIAERSLRTCSRIAQKG